MPTLYRKYRPQTFSEIAGQEHVKLTLSYEIKAKQVAHAYLFCGPRAIGKTTVARLLAKAMNCPNRKEDSADPCNKCQSCSEITESRSMDVAEIDAASNTSVDNVREAIIASARLAPSAGRYKIFIIDEAHMLSTSAWNALLKTMEEPPAHVIFILCTTEAHKVPPTIISRCQRFDFKKIGVVEIITKLSRIVREEKIKVGPGVLEAIARHANGHMRDAESLMGQVISLAGSENSLKGKEITLDEAELIIPRSYVTEAVEMLEYLANKEAGAAVTYVNRLSDNGADLKVFSAELVTLIRRLLITKISPELGANLGQELGEAIQNRIEPLLSKLEPDFLSASIERFINAGKEIKDAPFAQLPLELAIVDLCYGRLFSSDSVIAPLAPRPNPVAAPLRRPTANIAAAPVSRPKAGPEEPIAVNADPEAIKGAWQELLVRVKQHNHSLSFVLKSCQFMGIEGSGLKLAFKHKFHHDRINEPAIRQLVENLLGEIMGRRIVVETTLDPNLVLVENIASVAVDATAPSAASVAGAAVAAAEIDSSVIDNLLKTFGGRVVS
ncbi:MAG: DNA polymerase III subunit gamma/tau [Candidatus Falkowbacteria bacterium]|nr:DNA polymerase III subunit gamma/tau [Candidatus Falkowbacteria bacterium]